LRRGSIAGGQEVALDPDGVRITAKGKTNIIPGTAIARGNFRTLTTDSPTSQRSHAGLGPSFVDEDVDKDKASWIRPVLELLPLLAPPCCLGPQLFGGAHAFFEAQTLSVSEAPDLHVISLHAPIRQLGDKASKGEVLPRPLQQPSAPISRHVQPHQSAARANPLKRV
jgi:hypothetical protein